VSADVGEVAAPPGIEGAGPLAEIVVRSWGALIALVGAMLMYGAFQPMARPLILAVASLSKLTFIALVSSMARSTSAIRPGLPSRSTW
jgi:hypothetical protein